MCLNSWLTARGEPGVQVGYEARDGVELGVNLLKLARAVATRYDDIALRCNEILRLRTGQHTGPGGHRSPYSRMEIIGLGWSGTRTDRAEALARFYEQVLGLRLVHTEPHFWVFELPDGNHVEVFGEHYPGKEHFDTGPVVGFTVTNLVQAVSELRSAGIELIGEPGPTWQHFRGPDGNVYELVSRAQAP